MIIEESLKLINKLYDDIKHIFLFVINRFRKPKGKILVIDFQQYKPRDVDYFDRRKKDGVMWKIYAKKRSLFEGIPSTHFDISRLQIESIWTGLPFCPKCDCELEKNDDENKWICVSCGEKIRIAKHFCYDTQTKIIKAFKTDLQNEQKTNKN